MSAEPRCGHSHALLTNEQALRIMMFMPPVRVTPATVTLEPKLRDATLNELREFVETAFKNGATGTEHISAELNNRKIKKAVLEVQASA